MRNLLREWEALDWGLAFACALVAVICIWGAVSEIAEMVQAGAAS